MYEPRLESTTRISTEARAQRAYACGQSLARLSTAAAATATTQPVFSDSAARTAATTAIGPKSLLSYAFGVRAPAGSTTAWARPSRPTTLGSKYREYGSPLDWQNDCAE